MITSFAQDDQFLAIPLGSLEKRLACTHDANVKQQWLLRKNIVPSFTTLCGLFLKMKQMIAWFKYCDCENVQRPTSCHKSSPCEC